MALALGVTKLKYMTLFNDPNGNFSSKRLVTLLAAFLLLFAFAYDTFRPTEFDATVAQAIQWVVMAGLFASALDHFVKK